jgi:serpin B
MGRRNRYIAGIAATALLAAGCASAQATVPPPGQSKGQAAALPGGNARQLAAGDTAFGLGFLRAWCQAQPRDNLLYSPQTLATALGMAYLGARGGTAQAMARVLHLPAGSLLAGLQARTAALGALDGPGVTVSAVNQVWADPSLVTLRSYLDAVATGYGAGVERASLLKNPGLAARQIDQAISAVTRGQIPKLVDGQMMQDIGWVLTSALYLNAAWDRPFDPYMTEPGQFTTAAGQQVTASFMYSPDYRAVKAGGWTGVRLPYRGGKLAMYALLPPASAAGSCALPAQSVLSAMTAGAGTPANLGLPKLNLSSSGSAMELLAALGMGQAFGPAADFTALSPQAGSIGMVQQAATLQLSEKGTVASAAAAAGITPTAAYAGPAVTFDRPFFLMITGTVTGEPLFMARVTDASAR